MKKEDKSLSNLFNNTCIDDIRQRMINGVCNKDAVSERISQIVKNIAINLFKEFQQREGNKMAKNITVDKEFFEKYGIKNQQVTSIVSIDNLLNDGETLLEVTLMNASMSSRYYHLKLFSGPLKISAWCGDISTFDDEPILQLIKVLETNFPGFKYRLPDCIKLNTINKKDDKKMNNAIIDRQYMASLGFDTQEFLADGLGDYVKKNASIIVLSMTKNDNEYKFNLLWKSESEDISFWASSLSSPSYQKITLALLSLLSNIPKLNIEFCPDTKEYSAYAIKEFKEHGFDVKTRVFGSGIVRQMDVIQEYTPSSCKEATLIAEAVKPVLAELLKEMLPDTSNVKLTNDNSSEDSKNKDNEISTYHRYVIYNKIFKSEEFLIHQIEKNINLDKWFKKFSGTKSAKTIILKVFKELEKLELYITHYDQDGNSEVTVGFTASEECYNRIVASLIEHKTGPVEIVDHIHMS